MVFSAVIWDPESKVNLLGDSILKFRKINTIEVYQLIRNQRLAS